MSLGDGMSGHEHAQGAAAAQLPASATQAHRERAVRSHRHAADRQSDPRSRALASGRGRRTVVRGRRDAAGERWPRSAGARDGARPWRLRSASAAEPLKGQRVRALPGPWEAARAATDDGNGGSQRGHGQGCRSVAGPGSCGTDRERDARRAIDRQPGARGRDRRGHRANAPLGFVVAASTSGAALAPGGYAVATRSVSARLTRPSAWRSPRPRCADRVRASPPRPARSRP